MRSVKAVGFGLIIALAIELLLVFGIASPLFDAFVPRGLADTSALGYGVILFAAAFGMYWGGMAAGYKAASYHRLHGISVPVVLYAISSVLNLMPPRDQPGQHVPQISPAGVEITRHITPKNLLDQLQSPQFVILAAVIFAVSVAAAYIGSGRGRDLYAYNQKVSRLERRRSR
jgi:hypothetical protein